VSQTVLVDTVSAALAVERPQATIRAWAHRGLIHAHGKDKGRRALYDLAEVYRVAKDLSSRKRATRP
jgi:DNA-binding transcriptional MerR regulator